MGKIGKTFALVLTLTIIMSCLTFLTVKKANAQIVHATPSFVYSPLTPRVGDIVSFDALWWEQYWNQEHPPRTFSYSWNFGDGTYATGATVNHIFTKSGTYPVSVTVDDGLGTGGSSQMEVDVREQTPAVVYLSLSSDAIYTGQEVQISGNLTCNGLGMSDAIISISSKTYVEGALWKSVASVKTDGDGRYLAVWRPSFGAYQVKAAWAGNSTIPETSISVNLNVRGFGNLITEFSSNSTITGMNFNSTTRVLSFSAEGPDGTTGYVNITLEKESSFDPQDINVFLDGKAIEYKVYSLDQSWILSFYYSHSKHAVTVNFSESHGAPEFLVSIFPLIITALFVSLLCVVYFKKRKKKQILNERSVNAFLLYHRLHG